MQAADTSGRAEFVRQRLLSMKEQLHHLEVAILISVAGIDVRSTDGKVDNCVSLSAVQMGSAVAAQCVILQSATT